MQFITHYLPPESTMRKRIASHFIICNYLFIICLPSLDYKLHEWRDNIHAPFQPQHILSEGTPITPLLIAMEMYFLTCTPGICPFTHPSCKRNENLGRITGHVQLYHSLSGELPNCERVFFTSPLRPKSLHRKGLSWSSTAGTIRVCISSSEVQFIGSLMNFCPQTCSMSDRDNILLPSALLFFFLNY